MPYLAQISIFPIKSLDGVLVQAATVLQSGVLKGDREFAIIDAQGNFVNGKRNANVHRLRSAFDLVARTVSLRVEGTSETETFHLDGDRASLETWLSEYFGFPVQLLQNLELGFPDDTLSPGPTVISTATLQTVTGWFPGLSLEDTRRRFRTNLEIADTEPFWEDRLFNGVDSTQPFQIGAVQLEGVNPCQRCVVITRDALTGQAYPGFQKVFTSRRKETFPAWANSSRFNHFYRLAVNTVVSPSQANKVLKVGDPVGWQVPCDE
ncbi:MOSC domain-containing protein [Leptothermofonsia sp. ETS-13]|uniref:MOSC domain-containing protein n=1 Tax=Leptothermofonsia sp. ETS-13 TaxID=3035696 RepID=UPI003B9E98BD